MNASETVALLKLSRDEYVGVGGTDKPLQAESGIAVDTRPTYPVRGLKRWLLGLVNG
jgi:hypothetical protein